jgi:hypothetical protein
VKIQKKSFIPVDLGLVGMKLLHDTAVFFCFHETPTFYQNYLAMRNTADVTGGKPMPFYCSLSQVQVLLIL